MSYSCSDFADDILNTLKIEIPDSADDNPSEQADLAMAEIERLYGIEKPCGEVLKALKDIRGEIDLIQGCWTEGLDNFAQQADHAIALAAGVPFLSAETIVPLAIDWQKIAQALAGHLSNCMEQIGQMKGMFDDGDGSIQQAIDDADETLACYNAAQAGNPASAPSPLRLTAIVAGGRLVELVTDDLTLRGIPYTIADLDCDGSERVGVLVRGDGTTETAIIAFSEIEGSDIQYITPATV